MCFNMIDMVIGSNLLQVSKVQINKKNKCKTVNIFLPISLNIHFGCSKEPSH